jgi:hypothetical protein
MAKLLPYLARLQILVEVIFIALFSYFSSIYPVMYLGKDILEEDELVWIDDIEWDENRKVAAERRINEQGLN